MRMPHLPPSELARRMDGAPSGSGADLQEAWMRMNMEGQRNVSMQRMQEQESAWAAEFGSAVPQMQAPGLSGQSYNQPQQQSCE